MLRAQPTKPAPARWLLRPLAGLLLATTAACSRHIEEDPPIPEHRLAPCETWCALMFDPVCPAQDVEVPTEEECFEGCTAEEGIWAPVDGYDECASTYVPYVECLADLSCDELQQHFVLGNNIHDPIPAAEWSSCGELARAQLDCQTAHY